MNLLNWNLIWLAPWPGARGTQNSHCEFVCFCVLFQTFSQMVKIDPTTLNILIDCKARHLINYRNHTKISHCDDYVHTFLPQIIIR